MTDSLVPNGGWGGVKLAKRLVRRGQDTMVRYSQYDHGLVQLQKAGKSEFPGQQHDAYPYVN